MPITGAIVHREELPRRTWEGLEILRFLALENETNHLSSVLDVGLLCIAGKLTNSAVVCAWQGWAQEASLCSSLASRQSSTTTRDSR